MARKNESQKGGEVIMSKWKTPKTDWTEGDALEYKDFNRIKNNLVYLWEKVQKYWSAFEIKDMGSDITSYEEEWNVDYFNAIEENVDTINSHMYVMDYGFKQTFYTNGAFIKAEELNRIEGATLKMNQIIEGIQEGKTRLSFRFGAPKGLRL